MPQPERDAGDIDHEDDVDNGIAEHDEPAPPASCACLSCGREPGDREPPRQAGEAERDGDQEDRADRVSMAELHRIARAGRAVFRPDRGGYGRSADKEIHDSAGGVAEPADQRDRLGAGPRRHQAFRGVHDAPDSNECRGSMVAAPGRRAEQVTIIEGIAERIGAIRYEGLPAEAVRWAKAAILDTVGVTLAGAREPCARIAAEVAGLGKSGDGCVVFGTGQRAAPLDAALVNGTAAHAPDFDDVSTSLGGHPSASILPAISALGEVLDCTGRDFVTAYVAGFETETRIARGVHFHHYEKGWHPTATLGVFGAAAASCHLLGLDRAKTAQALAIAASLASGIKANLGTMTKPLHVGHTARNGLFAAMLAQGGFTASNAALEHRQGFLMVYNGEGTFNTEAILKDWGSPYDVTRPGPGFKQYPCCGSTHPVLDALLALRAEHPLPADKITRIDSWTHPRRLT